MLKKFPDLVLYTTLSLYILFLAHFFFNVISFTPFFLFDELFKSNSDKLTQVNLSDLLAYSPKFYSAGNNVTSFLLNNPLSLLIGNGLGWLFGNTYMALRSVYFIYFLLCCSISIIYYRNKSKYIPVIFILLLGQHMYFNEMPLYSQNITLACISLIFVTVASFLLSSNKKYLVFLFGMVATELYLTSMLLSVFLAALLTIFLSKDLIETNYKFTKLARDLIVFLLGSTTCLIVYFLLLGQIKNIHFYDFSYMPIFSLSLFFIGICFINYLSQGAFINKKSFQLFYPSILLILIFSQCIYLNLSISGLQLAIYYLCYWMLAGLIYLVTSLLNNKTAQYDKIIAIFLIIITGSLYFYNTNNTGHWEAELRNNVEFNEYQQQILRNVPNNKSVLSEPLFSLNKSNKFQFINIFNPESAITIANDDFYKPKFIILNYSFFYLANLLIKNDFSLDTNLMSELNKFTKLLQENRYYLSNIVYAKSNQTTYIYKLLQEPNIKISKVLPRVSVYEPLYSQWNHHLELQPHHNWIVAKTIASTGSDNNTFHNTKKSIFAPGIYLFNLLPDGGQSSDLAVIRADSKIKKPISIEYNLTQTAYLANMNPFYLVVNHPGGELALTQSVNRSDINFKIGKVYKITGVAPQQHAREIHIPDMNAWQKLKINSKEFLVSSDIKFQIDGRMTIKFTDTSPVTNLFNLGVINSKTSSWLIEPGNCIDGCSFSINNIDSFKLAIKPSLVTSLIPKLKLYFDPPYAELLAQSLLD